LQGFCWSVENSTACVYKDASGKPLLVAAVDKVVVEPGTKAIVTSLPPVSFAAAPKCKGKFNKNAEDESGRFWGYEVRLRRFTSKCINGVANNNNCTRIK